MSNKVHAKQIRGYALYATPQPCSGCADNGRKGTGKRKEKGDEGKVENGVDEGEEGDGEGETARGNGSGSAKGKI